LKADIQRLALLAASDHECIGDACYVTDGIHTSIDFEEGSGIKVISAKHPKDGFLDLRVVEEISARSHAANPRTALRINDVVLSTVGTIGNAAVVRSDILPANSDRHVAIIRTLERDRPISPEYLSVFLNSAYGRMQTIRETTGNVQPNLFLVKVRDLKIVRFSISFENTIHDWSLRAVSARQQAYAKVEEAELRLLNALDLADWSPPEPLTYVARASNASAAGRLDAQYFMPAKEQVRRSLAALPGQPLSDRVDSIREQWLPDRAAPDMLVRNYDVTDALVPLLDAEKDPMPAAEIGSMKKVLRDGDVAVSRLRAYLKEIAVVRTGGGTPSVGSSEFIVLRPKGEAISPEALMVFLRSAPVQTILKWCQDGSQHPRFSEGDLLSIPVPDAVVAVSAELTGIVQQGFAARGRARQLLNAAKRAVEIAIEDGEAYAMAYLTEAEEAA
jgi:type I restriction enzyme S subunit